MAGMPLQREVIEQLARDQPQVLVEIVLQQGAAIAGLEQRVGQLEEALRQGGGPPGAAPFGVDPHKRSSGTQKARAKRRPWRRISHGAGSD